MKPARRVLFCKPAMIDDCVVFHFAIFMRETDDEPFKYETVVSRYGDFNAGSISSMYDNHFPMLTQRQKLVDEFRGILTGRRRPTSRQTVKGEIASVRIGERLENVKIEDVPVALIARQPRPKKEWKRA